MERQTLVNEGKSRWKLLISIILGSLILAMGVWFWPPKKPPKKIIKPLFNLGNPSSSGLVANFYGPISPEILISKNKHIHLVNLFGSRCFRHVGVCSLSFSPDGSRLISTGDGTIKLWDMATQKEIRIFREHTRGIYVAVFSPDGKKIVSGSENKIVKIWNVSTGSEIRTLHGHNNRVISVAFSPDGTKIASGSQDKAIKVWDVSTGNEIHTLYGHTDGVKSVIFSPDGKKVISGSKDGTIKIWDVFTGHRIHTLGNTNSGNWVYSLAFSPDGTKIVSGYLDRFIKIWDVADRKSVV